MLVILATAVVSVAVTVLALKTFETSHRSKAQLRRPCGPPF
jgi:hypothetical protein